MEQSRVLSYIELAKERGASDVHLKTACAPVIRVAGDVCMLEEEPLTAEEILEFLDTETEVATEKFVHSGSAADFSISTAGVRLRGNAYYDNNGPCVALRLLTLIDSDFTELGIPEILKKLCERRSGLILITGPTGSGKTTTLTYLIEHINLTQRKHIIMLEDPIEFLHNSHNCIISQREVGRDVASFSDAIVEAMREDPDIIMVGEMRDLPSIEAALRAAETGHLVLSTLHTKGAVSSITRIVDIFPEGQQNQIRTQLSMALLAVISQQLCPGTEPGRRQLATEVMVATDSIRATIKQNKMNLVSSAIQTSRSDGMYTMRHSLDKLLRAGKITQQTYEDFQI